MKKKLINEHDNINLDFLENVFQTNFQQNVLISYITHPFIYGIKTRHHTNYLECYTAAEIFHGLNFNVDVVMYNSYLAIDYSKYEVIYGLGDSLDRIFYSESATDCLKIMYGTGCSTYFSVPQSVKRVHNFFRDKGIYILESARLDGLQPTHGMLSDLIISLGNNYVASTYKYMNEAIKVEEIRAFYFDVCDLDLDKKDFTESKKHFLWFGASGAIHKGLDIVIDYFLLHTDIHLHICGYVHKESKFSNYYGPIIDSTENIHYYGFVDIESEAFIELLNTCLFIVYPSISEGGAPSVLNIVSNGGLIPIISVNSGIDIPEGHGWTFDDISVEGLAAALEKIKPLDDIALKKMSLNIKSHFRAHYTFQKYKSRLKHLIEEAIYENRQKIISNAN